MSPAIEALIDSACQARERAHAPFSHFKVGAALQARDGRVITGCNVENASYGLTICAERVAMFKAVSDGITDFTHVVVVADTPEPTPPCGACRQVLWELGGNLEVILTNLHGHRRVTSLAALLPDPFDRGVLASQHAQREQKDRP